MIPLRLGSTAGFGGPGGHERGQECVGDGQSPLTAPRRRAPASAVGGRRVLLRSRLFRRCQRRARTPDTRIMIRALLLCRAKNGGWGTGKGTCPQRGCTRTLTACGSGAVTASGGALLFCVQAAGSSTQASRMARGVPELPSSPPIRAQRMVTGVPIGMRLASRRIAGLGTRMQPWEGRPGITQGWSVPWIPITPPPGQSDSAE
jgi:hypothetical protein